MGSTYIKDISSSLLERNRIKVVWECNEKGRGERLITIQWGQKYMDIDKWKDHAKYVMEKNGFYEEHWNRRKY